MSATAAALPATASSRRVALGLLLAAYTLSFLDRQIVGVLLDPIKREFSLSDTHLGFLSGTAFALFYATLGIPVAWLADRGNRKRIILWSLGIWSVMTAVCGFAQSFAQLAIGDRMEMAHSIEGRVPFLDHKVGEFLASTPVSLKIRAQTEKYILREATRSVITDTVYRRQKHPFLSPPESSAERSRMSELVRDTLRSSAVASIPFLDANAVHTYAADLDELSPQRRSELDSDTLLLVSMITLHERFGVAST